MNRRFIARLLLILALLWMSCVTNVSLGDGGSAQIAGPAKIIIGDDAAVVRESFQIMMTSSVMRVLIPDFPAEAMASSVNLVGASRIKLLAWRLSELTESTVWSPHLSGRSVRFDMENRQPPAFSGLQLELQAPSPGLHRFDLSYVVTGLSWRATYDVLLRGDLQNINSPMSIDVDGWIELNNQTARAYTQAVVTVVGMDTKGMVPQVKEPGILELDEESPLADLWRFESPARAAANLYVLNRAVDLPSSQSIMLSFVSVARKPVTRVLVFQSEEIPTDARGASYALPSQVIHFQNAADYGGGRSVPPGTAVIQLGSLRSSIYQEAWFKHTPALGNIRIDMGKFSGLTARRVDRGRVPRVGGGYEQRYDIMIANHLEEPVSIVLAEQPPLNFAWSVLRSNMKYDLLDRRLVFQPVAPAKSELVIQYTLLITIPSM